MARARSLHVSEFSVIELVLHEEISRKVLHNRSELIPSRMKGNSEHVTEAFNLALCKSTIKKENSGIIM